MQWDLKSFVSALMSGAAYPLVADKRSLNHTESTELAKKDWYACSYLFLYKLWAT